MPRPIPQNPQRSDQNIKMSRRASQNAISASLLDDLLSELAPAKRKPIGAKQEEDVGAGRGNDEEDVIPQTMRRVSSASSLGLPKGLQRLSNSFSTLVGTKLIAGRAAKRASQGGAQPSLPRALDREQILNHRVLNNDSSTPMPERSTTSLNANYSSLEDGDMDSYGEKSLEPPLRSVAVSEYDNDVDKSSTDEDSIELGLSFDPSTCTTGVDSSARSIQLVDRVKRKGSRESQVRSGHSSRERRLRSGHSSRENLSRSGHSSRESLSRSGHSSRESLSRSGHSSRESPSIDAILEWRRATTRQSVSRSFPGSLSITSDGSLSSQTRRQGGKSPDPPGRSSSRLLSSPSRRDGQSSSPTPESRRSSSGERSTEGRISTRRTSMGETSARRVEGRSSTRRSSIGAHTMTGERKSSSGGEGRAIDRRSSIAALSIDGEIKSSSGGEGRKTTRRTSIAGLSMNGERKSSSGSEGLTTTRRTSIAGLSLTGERKDAIAGEGRASTRRISTVGLSLNGERRSSSRGEGRTSGRSGRSPGNIVGMGRHQKCVQSNTSLQSLIDILERKQPQDHLMSPKHSANATWRSESPVEEFESDYSSARTPQSLPNLLSMLADGSADHESDFHAIGNASWDFSALRRGEHGRRKALKSKGGRDMYVGAVDAERAPTTAPMIDLTDRQKEIMASLMVLENDILASKH